MDGANASDFEVVRNPEGENEEEKDLRGDERG